MNIFIRPHSMSLKYIKMVSCGDPHQVQYYKLVTVQCNIVQCYSGPSHQYFKLKNNKVSNAQLGLTQLFILFIYLLTNAYYHHKINRT